MLKIRLQRAGAKKRPFYRIIAIDERHKRDGRAVEFLGYYNPIARSGGSGEFQVDTDKVEAWVAKGAQMSDRVRGLVRRARRERAAAAAAEGEAS